MECLLGSPAEAMVRHIMINQIVDDAFWDGLFNALSVEIVEYAKFLSFPSMGEISYSDGPGPTLSQGLKKDYPKGLFHLGFLGTRPEGIRFRPCFGIQSDGRWILGEVSVQSRLTEPWELLDVSWKEVSPSEIAKDRMCVERGPAGLWGVIGERIGALLRSKERAVESAEGLMIRHAIASQVLYARLRQTRASPGF